MHILIDINFKQMESECGNFTRGWAFFNCKGFCLFVGCLLLACPLKWSSGHGLVHTTLAKLLLLHGLLLSIKAPNPIIVIPHRFIYRRYTNIS